jgi:hypothetical protein
MPAVSPTLARVASRGAAGKGGCLCGSGK